MVRTLKDNFQQLYEVAESQGGYFTAKQATSAGYSTRMQTYHVQTGDWEREWRGVYRLHFYPTPRPDDLMVWYLWSSDRQGVPEGVYSHDTALELHELSTWSGNRLHMIVPIAFKRRVYPRPLRLHRVKHLAPSDITTIEGVRVTGVVRTILDLLQSDSIQRHHLVEAMSDAFKRGLINQHDLVKDRSKSEADMLKRLLDESQTYAPEG